MSVTDSPSTFGLKTPKHLGYTTSLHTCPCPFLTRQYMRRIWQALVKLWKPSNNSTTTSCRWSASATTTRWSTISTPFQSTAISIILTTVTISVSTVAGTLCFLFILTNWLSRQKTTSKTGFHWQSKPKPLSRNTQDLKKRCSLQMDMVAQNPIILTLQCNAI